MTKPILNIGLIGTGFMGKAHAFGYATARQVFDLPFDVQLHTVADQTDALAAQAAATLGFANSTGDWRKLVADPAIHLVSITAPNAFHREMTLAAIAAGKDVHCEKPLAPLAVEAREMTAAAKAAGVKTQVGFNYLCNPLFGLARDIIRSGELGEIYNYRGIHAEDYMIDRDTPFSFRHDPAGGGVLADLGSHALATAEFLLGPIDAVMGHCVNVVASRPDGQGRRPVIVDDISRAFLRFSNGATGSMEASWMSTGRKMQHDFEVFGSKASLAFSGERFNELHLYSTADASGRRGYRRIEAGPEHDPYGRFCVAPGHQLDFNDLKAIEMAWFLDAVAGNRPEPFGFAGGLRIQELLEAIRLSSRRVEWVETRFA